MVQVKRGDVYWYCCGGANAFLSEQSGLRPCLVVSNDVANEHSPIISVVPLTTAHKKHIPTHTKIYVGGKKSTVICEQIYSISKDRLGTFIGSCSKKELDRINRCLGIQLGLVEEW